MPEPDFINESLVRSLMYVEVPYYPTNYSLPDLDQTSTRDAFDENTISSDDDSAQPSTNQANAALDGFLENYDEYIQYAGNQTSRNKSQYFLRSQYGDIEGINISKQFIDTTPPRLQSGDEVYYEISFKNTSSQVRENIAYVDTIPKYFRFKNDEYILISDGKEESRERSSGVGRFQILLD